MRAASCMRPRRQRCLCLTGKECGRRYGFGATSVQLKGEISGESTCKRGSAKDRHRTHGVMLRVGKAQKMERRGLEPFKAAHEALIGTIHNNSR
jgi:hypothetical protein